MKAGYSAILYPKNNSVHLFRWQCFTLMYKSLDWTPGKSWAAVMYLVWPTSGEITIALKRLGVIESELQNGEWDRYAQTKIDQCKWWMRFELPAQAVLCLFYFAKFEKKVSSHLQCPENGWTSPIIQNVYNFLSRKLKGWEEHFWVHENMFQRNIVE